MAVSFSTAVYIESPPAVVFEALSNLDAAAQWVPDFVRIEKLTAGPLAVGSEWRTTRKVFGKESTEQMRVVRLDRNARLDLLVDGSKGDSRRGEYAFVFELVPERTGTNLELTGDIRMPGLWALGARVKRAPFKKACHKALEALKAHLESPWPAHTRP
jgi:uncharacterized protein YndB with AHSA1/START domain